MDPQRATPPTPAAAPTPIAVNPLNGRPIFLNTLPPLTEVAPTGTTPPPPSPLPPNAGPAPTVSSTATSKPNSSNQPVQVQSYALHFAGCRENCSSAISWTLVVVALVVASGIFMFLHRRKRMRVRNEEPVMSVSTKFTGGARDVRSPFDATGFSSFDAYNRTYEHQPTDSYYEQDGTEAYVGVAGFAAAKEQRQSQHAGIGGFGVTKSQEPMPAMPTLVMPMPTAMSAEEQAKYDEDFAEYQDEWERYQQQEEGGGYRGGHDSTVEGLYFSPQDYADGGGDQPHGQHYHHHHHDVDVDEDHAFEPSPYFANQPQHQDDDEEDGAYAVPMPQFEVEEYYVRDHLDAVAPTANAPQMQINWMSEEEKNYWDTYNNNTTTKK